MKDEYIVGGIVLVLLVGAGAFLSLHAKPMDAVSVRAGSSLLHDQGPYHEIVNPSGFVNTDPITLKELVGNKVILIDFVTYSCINCQRTFPYLNAWYEKYKNQGLEIVAIHTPEFAFEHKIDNVREAMRGFGIMFPIVLDNDYATWRAWGNQYWPRKYLIDINGRVVYDHIGEGKYDETERAIQEALKARAEKFGTGAVSEDMVDVKEADLSGIGSPETYFGAGRNEYLGNGVRGRAGLQTLVLPEVPALNVLYLGGNWNLTSEYAESESAGSVVYRYRAKNVYLVAAADAPITVTVLRDGKPVAAERGKDVSQDGTVVIQTDRLYHLIQESSSSEHTIEIRIEKKGLKAYAFTFG